MIVEKQDQSLIEMHKAFGGNAKAMEVLSKAIQQDYKANSRRYWQDNKDCLLIESTLENLVKEQFRRLKELNLTDAYNLLCRLGCYRYQDVPTVPEAGLNCLLWDVSENQHKRTIRLLKERALVEFNNSEYWLHPVIREVSIERLRNSDEWENANRNIANHFNEISIANFSPKIALHIFESFYHFYEIKDYNNAYNIIAYVINTDNSIRYIYKHLRFWGYSHRLIESLEKLKLKRDILNNRVLIGSIGVCYYYLNQYQKAIDIFNEVKVFIENSNEYEYRRLYPETLQYIARIYCFLGKNKQAIKYAKEGLIFLENNISYSQEQQCKDAASYYVESVASSLYQSLSFIYYELGEYEQCLTYSETAFNIAKISENKILYREAGDACLTKGLALFGFQKYDDAITLIEQSIEYFDKIEDLSGKGYAHLFIARIYLKKDINKSKEHLEWVEDIYQKGFKSILTEALFGQIQSEYFREIKNHEKAIEYHHTAINLLEQNSIKPDLAEAYFQLALTYQQMGNQSNAQEYFNKALYLWSPEQIDAPKQIERVKQAMNQ